MERAIMTQEMARAILGQVQDAARARIFEGTTQQPQQIQKIVLDLTTARLETQPYQIKFPFRSFYVQDATDTIANIFVKPTTQDSVQSFFTVKKNDSWASDYPISSAFLHWDAQSGKSITLVFFSEAEFRSGSQISVTGGGVSIVEGSTYSQAALTFVAATQLQIFAADTTRKVGTFQNKTGASVWVGGAAVTNTTAYYEVLNGADFIWKNTGILYGYSVAGGSGHKTEEF